MHSVRLNSWEYHRFTPSGCKETGIRKFELRQIFSLFIGKRNVLCFFSSNVFFTIKLFQQKIYIKIYLFPT